MVAVASLPKEIAAGLHPEQSNAIRGLLLQSGWVVEKLEDDSCVVTYVVQVHRIKMFTFLLHKQKKVIFNAFLLMALFSFSWILQDGCPSALSIDLTQNWL